MAKEKKSLILGSAIPPKEMAQVIRKATKDSISIDLSDPNGLKNVFFNVSGPVHPKNVEALRWLLQQVTPKTGPQP